MAFTRVSLGIAILACLVSPAFGQSTAPVAVEHMPSWGSLFGELPHDIRRLPSRVNALWLGTAGAVAIGIHGADASLTRQAVASGALDTTLNAGAVLGGGPVQAGGALAIFTLGRLTGSPAMATIGNDLVRTQIIDTVATQGIKISVARRRPNGGHLSFPSGHTSSSFATATVLLHRLGWKVGAPAMAMAAYVAASRVQDNEHYPSDVVFGAAIGIISGRSVTIGHGKTRLALVPTTAPGSLGVALTSAGTH